MLEEIILFTERGRNRVFVICDGIVIIIFLFFIEINFFGVL